MTFATRLTKVRDCSEHFDERTRMCYHQAPPAERVVVHVRGAGQAKPHLEHNPLSLLGTCYATPRRKLNDPAFYRDVLGLEVGLRDERRPWLFLRAGGQAGMLLLQEDKGEWPTQHLAFTVDADEIERAAATLREHGVVVRGPVFHAWMPATSVYFADPDGHQLELC